MYSITRNGDRIQYGVNQYLADSIQDLKQLNHAAPGSKAYVLSELKTYIKTNEGNWEKYVITTSGSGGGEISEDYATKDYVDTKISNILNGTDPDKIDGLLEALDNLENQITNKSQVQIITWEADD